MNGFTPIANFVTCCPRIRWLRTVATTATSKLRADIFQKTALGLAFQRIREKLPNLLFRRIKIAASWFSDVEIASLLKICEKTVGAVPSSTSISLRSLSTKWKSGTKNKDIMTPMMWRFLCRKQALSVQTSMKACRLKTNRSIWSSWRELWMRSSAETEVHISQKKSLLNALVALALVVVCLLYHTEIQTQELSFLNETMTSRTIGKMWASTTYHETEVAWGQSPRMSTFAANIVGWGMKMNPLPHLSCRCTPLKKMYPAPLKHPTRAWDPEQCKACGRFAT